MNESISLQNHDGILIEGKITKLEKWELEVEITKPFRNWRNSYKMNEVEIRQGCLMVNEYEETGIVNGTIDYLNPTRTHQAIC